MEVIMKKSSLMMLNAGIMVLMLSGYVFAQQGMMRGDYGPGMAQEEYQSTRLPREPIDKERAKAILSNYLNTLDNGELKPGEISDQGTFFAAEILTRDDKLVNRMQIDKRTGRIYNPGYGYDHYGMRGYDYGAGRSNDWNYCPYCGREYQHRGYGPGMMHRGYGPGMMHRGYGPGMMMPGYGWLESGREPGEPGEPMDKDRARQIVDDYLQAGRNPNLKIGDIKEKKDGFEVKIVTSKSGDLVDVVLVDRDTGYMRSLYQ